MLEPGSDIWLEEEACAAALEAVAAATMDFLNGTAANLTSLSWTGYVLTINGKEEALANAVFGQLRAQGRALIQVS